MQHLDFIVWMGLWPIVTSAESYINAKTKTVEGKDPMSVNDKATAAFIKLIIWAVIAKLLF